MCGTDPRRNAWGSGNNRHAARPAGDSSRLDRAVAANDEVVSVEVEAFNRRREERRVVAIPAAGPRETLHPDVLIRCRSIVGTPIL